MEALRGERILEWVAAQLTWPSRLFPGMTLDPAYASFSEQTLGSISIGKRADYVVFSQDIMTIPAEKILQTKVLATVIDGRPVYGSV